MTKQEAITALLAWLRAQIGYVEGDNNHNKYAESGQLKQLYGWKAQNQPWCDLFVDAGFLAVFGLKKTSQLTYQPIGQGSAACRYSAGFYSAHGAYYQSPEVGDQIFFYVGDGINHTGIVEVVTDHYVTTIEGNTSDMVARRTYRRDDSSIAGYGRPNWEIFSSSSTPTASTGENTKPSAPEQPKQEVCCIEIQLPVIQYGDASMWVKLMQTALIGKGFNCGWYGADGEYGQQTKIALYEFQKKNGLDADNICGQETWKSLLNIG